MKRIAIALALCTLAFAAYAGPYFEVENVGLYLQPSVLLGCDFYAPFVDYTNLSISGDFYVINDNLAVNPTPWIGGFNLDFAFCNEVARDVFEVGLGMDIELVPAETVLEFATLTSWTTDIGFDWYPSDIATFYGIVGCKYDLIDQQWDFTPTIGLEVHWP